MKPFFHLHCSRTMITYITSINAKILLNIKKSSRRVQVAADEQKANRKRMGMTLI